MESLSGKRIVILGFARQGEALARFAAAAGAEVIVSDLREREALEPAITRMIDAGVSFVLGSHPQSLLDGANVLAISGGVPATIPLVQAARAQGIRVTNDSLEFALRSPAEGIGVTGSAGKTTTTALLGAMGRAAGRRTWVGGNIGHPLLADLPLIAADDLVVQELSSFQLELWSPAWGNKQVKSPAVATVLNITPNHLDRHGTMAAYARAKANLLRGQRLGDVAVLCADDGGAMRLSSQVKGRLRTYSKGSAVEDGAFVRRGQLYLRDGYAETPLLGLDEIPLRGEHNVLNVLAAATAADSARISPAAMRQAIRSFTGVEHRLENVAVVNGVLYVNDSIATAPERALAAIDAFSEPLVLLAGGRDKDMVWEGWAQRAAHRVRHVILFGELAPLLATKLAAVEDASAKVSSAHSLEEAVARAAAVAVAGDVVLFAPGGTSFDAFRDFAERGERFRALVAAL